MGSRPSRQGARQERAAAQKLWSEVLRAWPGQAPQSEKAEVEALRSCQARALLRIRRRSSGLSRIARPELLRRTQDLGYSEGDLEATLAYIRDQAPVIVHLDLELRAAILAEDTHYRNMFETQRDTPRVHVQSREEWESKLFRKEYDSAAAFDRCKYGVLNSTNDPHGVRVCAPVYGSSFLVLQGVRMRTTLSAEDSAGLDALELATLDNYAHVLLRYTDPELRATLEVGTRRQLGVSSLTIAAYKEAQIHGEIRLQDHVAVVMAHPSLQHTCAQAAERLAARCGAPLVWIEAEADSGNQAAAPAPAEEDEDMQLGMAMSQLEPSPMPVSDEDLQLGLAMSQEEDDLRRAMEASMLVGRQPL